MSIDQYQEELKETARVGNKLVLQFLEGKLSDSKIDREKIRMGTQSVRNYQAYLGSKGANDALKLMAIKSITEDKDEIKTLIQRHLPNQFEVPLLPEGDGETPTA